MFQYKCTIFREHNVPGLKPSDSDKLLLYKVLQSVVGTVVDATYV